MVTFDESFAAEEAAVDTNTEIEAPTDGGQGEDVGEGSTESAAPSYFDFDSVGDQVAQVTVNGEVQDVPLSELRDGYMRQAAFTQNSQALAAEKAEFEGARALASAYKEDPAATVRFLAEQNGITLGEATAVAEQAEQDSDWADTGQINDPRIDAFEARFAELDRREARMEVEQTIGRLENTYGDAFDKQAVINRAIEDRSDNLETTFFQMMGERAMAQQAAAATVGEREAAAEAAALAAKQAVGSSVVTGGSANGAGAPYAEPITSVASALDSAFAEHGEYW